MPDSPPSDLAAIRAEIDRLDDQLHDLLMERAHVVAGLAGARAKTGPAFRPGRETQVLRRLLARHSGSLPRAALIGIWREIISASLAQQGSFAVAVLAPAMDAPTALLARAHFGSLTPMRIHGSAPATFAALSEASVAVLPLPEDAEPQPWWPMLEAPRLQILARLPVLDQPGPAALVVGPGPAEPSGDDVSLFRFEPPEGQSRAGLMSQLAAAGLPPRRLITAPYAALVEVEGFLDPADPRLAALPFHGLRPLGAYALPETGDAS